MAMLNNQMVYQLQFESIPIDPIVLMVKNHKEPKKKNICKNMCKSPFKNTNPLPCACAQPPKRPASSNRCVRFRSAMLLLQMRFRQEGDYTMYWTIYIYIDVWLHNMMCVCNNNNNNNKIYIVYRILSPHKFPMRQPSLVLDLFILGDRPGCISYLGDWVFTFRKSKQDTMVFRCVNRTKSVGCSCRCSFHQ